MNELSQAQIKPIEQSVLDKFDAVCKQLNLRYTLIYGTLLGAVRHKGFIPWDDDIDVAMPRPDYDKFVAYCTQDTPPFGFVFHETDDKWVSLAGKIYDKSTVAVDAVVNRYDCECGVFVDIFPIDGLGDSEEEAKKTMKKSRFSRELLNASDWKAFRRSKTHAWYIEPIRLAFFLLSRMTKHKKTIAKIEKTVRKYEFDECAYVGIICGAYREREIMERNVYAEYAPMEFEGKPYESLANADAYLSKIYGNYMQLPPEEKRVTHHTFAVYAKEETDGKTEDEKE